MSAAVAGDILSAAATDIGLDVLPWIPTDNDLLRSPMRCGKITTVVVYFTAFPINEEQETMCFADVLQALRAEDLDINEYKIRAALRSGRLDRPPLDSSNRFVFGAAHLDQIRKLFANQTKPTKQGATP